LLQSKNINIVLKYDKSTKRLEKKKAKNKRESLIDLGQPQVGLWLGEPSETRVPLRAINQKRANI